MNACGLWLACLTLNALSESILKCGPAFFSRLQKKIAKYILYIYIYIYEGKLEAMPGKYILFIKNTSSGNKRT